MATVAESRDDAPMALDDMDDRDGQDDQAHRDAAVPSAVPSGVPSDESGTPRLDTEPPARMQAQMPTDQQTRTGTDTRIEHDTMGEIRVPASALWGAQTQRAVENFPISGVRMDPAVISALALIKASAARVNADLKVIDAEVADAVIGAAEEVAAGRHDDQFPIDVFQTGSGTSTNMNVNEVVAALAGRRLGRPVHPNDHVNASQSS